MYKRIIGIALLLFTMGFLHGCGSSEKSPPTKAVASMKGVALATGQIIAGLEITILLPPGVSAQSVSLSGVPLADITAPTPGSAYYDWNATELPTKETELAITAAVPTGFGEGQSIDIDCTIADGAYPTETSFLIYGFKAVDQYGATITGLWPKISTVTFY